MRAHCLLVLPFVLCVQGNLEGPFLIFGPKHLEEFRKPALESLNQDDLMRIYSQQQAIVVFNNLNPVPLTGANFPRLRKLLEGMTSLVLTQDFLEVDPDYISNQTQMLILQGPWSERDAKMTETFERLQDVYGRGNVLGILGNSMSKIEAVTVPEDTWAPVARPRRRADSPTTAWPPAEGQTYSLYNATGPPGKSILLYTTGNPVLEFANGTTITLDTPVGEPTVKPTRIYTSLVVRFLDKTSKDKITVEFTFKQSVGWWQAVGVEVKFGLETAGLNLQAPAPPDAPGAILGRSYQCPLPLVYQSEEATLRLPDIMLQVYMTSTEAFSDSFSCIHYFTVPIWSGIFVSGIVIFGVAMSVMMIMDIKTMDRFENNKNKQLPITVNE